MQKLQIQQKKFERSELLRLSNRELYEAQRAQNTLCRAAYKVYNKELHQTTLANLKLITAILKERKR